MLNEIYKKVHILSAETELKRLNNLDRAHTNYDCQQKNKFSFDPHCFQEPSCRNKTG